MKRKYYRMVIHRFPPYSFINNSYRYEEDTYAYSEEGALKTYRNKHKRSYGRNRIESIREIPKEEYRGYGITRVIEIKEEMQK